jgi:hypothetical protein
MYTYPAEVFKNFVISFAGEKDLIAEGLEQECEISLDNFRRGGVKGLIEIYPNVASNILTNLFQRAWYSFARARGLAEFPFANNKFGFFLPLPEKGIERVKFFSPSGGKGSRALIGKSEKRKVYWHYTPELTPSLGRSPRFTLFPHVIFTKDGLAPVGDSARMHTLRRSFCRSWWQDRWRDLGFAYLSLLTDGAADLEIPLAPDKSLVVHATFETFKSSVSVIMDSTDPTDQDDSVDELNDEEDFDEDFEGFDDLGLEDEATE